ncbi:MAG TPA: DNA recombination protein RmuC [Candidatus Eisenbacteria bacterium]|nr:DNA recombination protein RmuC [Candidatus Eisenbacteria bacterium]
MTAAWWVPAAAAGGALVVGAILVLLWLLRSARARRDDGAGLLLLQQQMDALRTQMGQALTGQGQTVGQQLAQLTAQVNDRLRESLEVVQRSQTSVGERLDNTARVVGEVQKGLGELREATAKVYDVGRSVQTLHDILRAPKLRGGFGEYFLADLLAQVLPAEHFTLQHGFRSGERVDAVIRLGDGLVPVDAKFPLEDFRRMLDAADDDARARARKGFVARVRKHVDDVAAKYVLPDEGTYDFALMYVPAENVFYEAVVRDEARELVSYALERKVIPVSPGTLYAYLQAIVLGLRGLRIEARAKEVLDQLARLGGDLERLRDDMRLVGRHLGNAQQAFISADRRLERFEQKLELAGGIETQEQDERPVVAQLELRAPSTPS